MSCTAPALLRVTMMLLTLIPLTWGLIVLGGHWLIGQPVGPQVAAIGALVLLGLSSLAAAAARPGWRSILAMSYFWGLSCGLVLLQLGGDAWTVPARCVLLAVAMLPAAV